MIVLHRLAPDFTLPDQNNAMHSLHTYRGKWVLLYFYPKDDTPGCTTEACTIRDRFADFEAHAVTILGISKDSPSSHRKFGQKYRLPFTLLADENKKVQSLYGVWQLKQMMGREYMGTVRSSFLIDSEGKIAKIYAKVDPKTHAEQILQDLAELKKEHHDV